MNVLFDMQHAFSLENRDELVKSTQAAAANFVGIGIKQRKDAITFEQFQDHRLGKYRQVLFIEFQIK